jgi:murein L,D-transpeptidase YcbB/YkuD
MDNVGVSGYWLFRNGSPIANVMTGLMYDDTNVGANANYNYAVRAYDAAGNNSPQSPMLSVATPGVSIMGVSPPQPPSPVPLSQTANIPPENQKTLFTKLLKRGSRGGEVLTLQQFLKAKGFFPASTVPSGFFGEATERALQAFQKSRGIETVGSTGPKTRAALNRL